MEAVKAAMVTAQPQDVKAHSVGVNDKNEMVAEFWITWSFKIKS
jgi:hypothetical protein